MPESSESPNLLAFKLYVKGSTMCEQFSHRQLGEQLDLFHFSDLAQGSCFWHPKGMSLYDSLSQYCRSLNRAYGYQEVKSPLLYSSKLWEQSGHMDKFRENMFLFESDGEAHGLKPMNCPGHIEIYQHRPRSYRELPLRFAEQGIVHRNESSGSVNGLLRCRSFAIDDAHIFCRPDQIEQELFQCLSMAQEVYRKFDLPIHVDLSLRPEQRLGSDALWDAAEGALRSALDRVGIEYQEMPGEGAFYGPKVDLHIQDSLGRSWQMGSVQLDYQMPERFDLSYVPSIQQAEPARPVIVHRAMFGSFERFIGILLEHYRGAFPVWMAPVQAWILPIADRHESYAQALYDDLFRAGIRVEIQSKERLSKRILEAEQQKVPMMFVVGDQEVEQDQVAWRYRGEQSCIARADILEYIHAVSE